MPPTPLVTALRVRYAECDMQGHVFNGHYLMYYDLAFAEALRAVTGLAYAAMLKAHGVDYVTAESGIRYLAPAHFDDVLEIAVTFDPPSTTALTSRYAVTRDAEPIATGFLRHVCVGTTKPYTKTPIPDAVRAQLAPYVAS